VRARPVTAKSGPGSARPLRVYLLTMSLHRRGFLQAGALGGFILAGCERPAAPDTGAPVSEPFTPAQLAGFEAIAMRILPSDDGTAGAKEAGVLGFIERVMAGPYAGYRRDLADGLADLDRRAGGTFASQPADRQDALLRDIEKTTFFGYMRYLTIAGMFSDPSWGGNREKAGWKLLGFDDRAIWQAPFGAYDANPGEDA
jgi:gluconate 2-dehydrogenase gamma chain